MDDPNPSFTSALHDQMNVSSHSRPPPSLIIYTAKPVLPCMNNDPLGCFEYLDNRGGGEAYKNESGNGVECPRGWNQVLEIHQDEFGTRFWASRLSISVSWPLGQDIAWKRVHYYEMVCSVLTSLEGVDKLGGCDFRLLKSISDCTLTSR